MRTITVIERQQDVLTLRIVEDNREWTVQRIFAQFQTLHLQVSRTPGFRGPYLPDRGTFGIRQRLDIASFNTARAEEIQEYITKLEEKGSSEVRQKLGEFFSADADGSRTFDGDYSQVWAMPKDCEWMFGDLSSIERYNPVRWSGSISFAEAIAALEAERQKADRAIVVKIPAGYLPSSRERLVPNIQAAIDCFDSAARGIHTGRSDEDIPAGFSAREHEDCQWRFGDVNPVATINPLRWSGRIAYATAIGELQRLPDSDGDRPVVVRLFNGINQGEQECASASKATEYLEHNLATETVPPAQASQDCRWRFGDVNPLGPYNPLRWSSCISFAKAIGDLEREAEKQDRPIVVRLLADGSEHKLDDLSSATSFLQEMMSNKAQPQIEPHLTVHFNF